MPFYDFSCRTCGQRDSIFTQTVAGATQRPVCKEHGAMERDYSLGIGKIDFQEKGVFPYYDIQTDRTFQSYKEMTGFLRARGLHPQERDEVSSRNQQMMAQARRGRKRGLAE